MCQWPCAWCAAPQQLPKVRILPRGVVHLAPKEVKRLLRQLVATSDAIREANLGYGDSLRLVPPADAAAGPSGGGGGDPAAAAAEAVSDVPV